MHLERLLLLDSLGALALLALVLFENDGALAIAVAALRLHLLNHARTELAHNETNAATLARAALTHGVGTGAALARAA
jgi:hypothetical protein